MKLIDTNIIIHFLTRQPIAKAEKCRQLFEKASAGRIQLYISDLVIAEVVWVLEKFFKCGKTEVRKRIEAILSTPNLFFQNKEIISESIVIYDVHGIDFVDAYHAVLMRKKEVKEIFTYDTDFDSFEWIERKAP